MTTIDTAAKAAGSDVTYGDLIDIGAALLNWSAVARLARHATPHGSTDYADPGNEFGATIVRDFINWCSGHSEHAERDRILTFLHRSGWVDSGMPLEVWVQGAVADEAEDAAA